MGDNSFGEGDLSFHLVQEGLVIKRQEPTLESPVLILLHILVARDVLLSDENEDIKCEIGFLLGQCDEQVDVDRGAPVVGLEYLIDQG